MRKIVFLSYMKENDRLTIEYLQRLAGKKNESDVKQAIDEGLIVKCGKDTYGALLYRITSKGIKYRNS